MDTDLTSKKIPLDIIAGFKNAGKTSLINSLANSFYKDKTLSVFTNEIGIASHEKQCLLHTVTGGCICCDAQTELISSIRSSISAESPDRIILELSGKGNIRDILPVFSFLPECRPGQLIYVLNVHKFSALSSIMGSFFPEQLKLAPVILLNHWYELPPTEQDALCARIRQWNPNALLPKDFREVDPKESCSTFSSQRQPVRIRGPKPRQPRLENLFSYEHF